MNKLPLETWLELLEKRHPVKIDLGLERVASVATRLDALKPAPLTITVAGTNGKGSCVAMLEYLLIQSGYHVGCFTSPHLLAFNERIRIQGVAAEDEALCLAFAAIEQVRGDTSLTYFEFNALAALLLMQQSGVDVAVLEVGLGGRLDAVNIVDPDVAVITSIDLDHTEWLGTDRGRIALEKAGIARPGRPLVCAEPDPPVMLQDYLQQSSVPCLYLERDFRLIRSADPALLDLVCRRRDGSPAAFANLGWPKIPIYSALAAVQALLAAGISPNPATVQDAFAKVQLAGRYQKLTYLDRQVIVDVAHNPAAARYLTSRLKQEAAGRCHVVAAMMKDKDVAGFIEPLQSVADGWYLGNLPAQDRALPADQLSAMVYNAGGKAFTFSDIGAALRGAVASSSPNDLIVVCGSFITAGQALALISPDFFQNE